MATFERLTGPLARWRSDDGPPLGLTLLSGAVAAAVLSPIVWLVLRVLDIDTGYALALATRPQTIEILLTTVALVAVVTVGCVLIGVPLAFLTSRTDLPFRRVWTVVVALPLVVPDYFGAFTFISAFGPSGQVADMLASLGVDWFPTIYGFWGTALVLTLYTYPYVFITTRASLLSFDRTLVEAARTLETPRWEVVRRVTLPQLLPGIASGALLASLYALSDYGTPALMRLDVFTRVIYVEYKGFGRETAALLSVQLLAITAVILAVQSRIGNSAQGAYVGTSSAGEGETDINLGWWKVPAVGLCTLIATLCLLVPLGVLALWFLRSPEAARLGQPFRWSYALNSALVSGGAAVACAAAALPIAYLAARYRSTLGELFDRATYVGYAMPGIVLGLSLVFFGAAYAPVFYQTLPLLVFAYVVRFLPQAIGATRSAVRRVDRNLTDAARLLGRSPVQSFREVTLPLITPGVIAGAALVFLTTMKELPATLLLHPTGFTTLVTYIWAIRESGYYGAAALPALVLIVVSSLSMVVILSRET